MPSLYDYYFPDAPQSAASMASRRFKKWNRAFESWLRERERTSGENTIKKTRLAWKRLVCYCKKMPWEINPQDMQGFRRWMKEEGLASVSINSTLGIIGIFYQWCQEHRIDPACPEDFNPLKGVDRIKRRKFEAVSLWNAMEVSALFGLLRKDPSPLAKRDTAFFRLRLGTGALLKNLLELRWEQVGQDDASAWICWREHGPRISLPQEAWHAVQDYLSVSGRLDNMQAGTFVFVLLLTPSRESTGYKREDWLEDKPLSIQVISKSLKRYGRSLGIPEAKLNLAAMKRTAIMQRLEAGESLEGMQAFMNSCDTRSSLKYKLELLKGQWLRQKDDTGGLNIQVEPPCRSRKDFVGSETLIHGYYRRRQDPQAVKKVLAQNIERMDDEIHALQELMQGLLDRELDDTRLLEVYSRLATSLGNMLSSRASGDDAAQHRKDSLTLDAFDQFYTRLGSEFSRQALQQAVARFAGSADEKLAEQVASVRVLLGNVYRRANENVDDGEYIHLANLYGLGCVRLSKLLKIRSPSSKGRLDSYISWCIDEAIRQFWRENVGEEYCRRNLHPGNN